MSPEPMTVEAFLAWKSGDGRRYELIDGIPRRIEVNDTMHCLLHAELAALVGNHLERRGSACRVATNVAVTPRVLAGCNVRAAEIAVTCAPIRPDYYAIPEPVLLIEVQSAIDRAKTWSNVWAYTTIPSVREILVLQSDAAIAQILRRDAGGDWPEAPEKVATGDLILTSIDFRVTFADLYAGTGLVGWSGRSA